MSGFADVSVIVAAYQAAGTIGRTLASIAGQTLKPREVVVVDDGSADGTMGVAVAFRSQMNGIELRTFRSDENQGAGAARNRAIGESTQPYLAFLDADDEWLPEKLARSMAVLKESGAVLIAHDYITGEGGAARHHHCERRFREGDPFVGLYRKGYIASCSVVCERAAVINAGGFDPGLRNAQDFDLWLAMLKNPETRFVVFDEPLLRYHVTAGGIMSHTRRRLRCALLIAERYFPDLGQRPGSALMSLWFRVAALHLEAARAHAKKGRLFALLATTALFPFRLVVITAKSLFIRPVPRGSLFSSEEPVSMDRKYPVTIFLWLWVVAITVAYSWQFLDLFMPILGSLGIR
ncbi:MAG: glycosyltransferase family 2 protein [Proteobacteria bacterium]|nr:glycosyltransferase family 2 protein [Pseudomonadota bacterium]